MAIGSGIGRYLVEAHLREGRSVGEIARRRLSYGDRGTNQVIVPFQYEVLPSVTLSAKRNSMGSTMRMW